MNASTMLRTHPQNGHANLEAIAGLIDVAFACEQACTACADACLSEENVQRLARCIRTDLDCADICATTGRLLSRQTETSREVVRAQVEACATVCRVCAEECEQHADMHEHCRVCAEACRRCEEACQRVLDAVGATA